MDAEIYYFSGTGNSYYLTKMILDHFQNSIAIPIHSLDLTRSITPSAKTLGIVCPIYCLDAPRIVKKFVKQLLLKSSTYVFLFFNSGSGRGGNATFNINRILNQRNHHLSAFFGLALPENSILYSTKPERMAEMFDLAEAKVKSAVAEIKSQKPITDHERTMGTLFNGGLLKLGVSFLGYRKMRVIPGKCTGCGICQKVCPVKNIELPKGQPQFGHKCEMCFACIHSCGSQAIRFKRMKERKDFQYRNPYVSLKEMVEKNY